MLSFHNLWSGSFEIAIDVHCPGLPLGTVPFQIFELAAAHAKVHHLKAAVFENQHFTQAQIAMGYLFAVGIVQSGQKIDKDLDNGL